MEMHQMLNLVVLLAVLAALAGTACMAAPSDPKASSAFGGVSSSFLLPNISVANEDVDAFNRWFWKLSPKVNWKVATLPSQYGNGIYVTNRTHFPHHNENATVGVKERELVIEVPVEFTVGIEGIKRKSYGKLLGEKVGLSEEERVTLCVVVEWLLGKKSRLYRWMKVVPQPGEILPPYLWTQEEQSHIEPKSTRDSTRNGYHQRSSEFQRIQSNSNQIVKKLNAAVAKKLGIPSAQEQKVQGKAITLELYLWAKALIETRAWNMNGHKYFVPFADMFNHKPDKEEEEYDYRKKPSLYFRSQKFVAHHKISQKPRLELETEERIAQLAAKEGTDVAAVHEKLKTSSVEVLQVMADRSTPQGEQLYESYGDNSNSIFFDYHGFIPEEGNKYDCQEVVLEPKGISLGSAPKNVLSQIRGLSKTYCAHLGEIPQSGMIVSIVSVMSQELASSSCVLAATKGVDATQRPYRTMAETYKKLRNCAKQFYIPNATPNLPTTALADPAGEIAFHKFLLRANEVMYNMILASFKAQFSTSSTKKDQAELDEIDQQMAEGTAADNAWKIRFALRHKIGRKQILQSILSGLKKQKRNLEKHLKKAEDAAKDSENEKNEDL